MLYICTSIVLSLLFAGYVNICMYSFIYVLFMIYYLMYFFSIPPFRYLLLHSSTHPLIRVFIFIHTSYLITFNCLFVSYVICLHDIFVFVYLFKPPFDIFMYLFIGFSCAYYFIYSIINSCMHSLMYLSICMQTCYQQCLLSYCLTLLFLPLCTIALVHTITHILSFKDKLVHSIKLGTQMIPVLRSKS